MYLNGQDWKGICVSAPHLQEGFTRGPRILETHALEPSVCLASPIVFMHAVVSLCFYCLLQKYLLTLLPGGCCATEGGPIAAADAGPLTSAAVEVPAAAAPPFLVTNERNAAELADQLKGQLAVEDQERLRSLDFMVPIAAIKTLSHALLAIADWVLAPQVCSVVNAWGSPS
jgi:hypothetical protein